MFEGGKNLGGVARTEGIEKPEHAVPPLVEGKSPHHFSVHWAAVSVVSKLLNFTPKLLGIFNHIDKKRRSVLFKEDLLRRGKGDEPFFSGIRPERYFFTLEKSDFFSCLRREEFPRISGVDEKDDLRDIFLFEQGEEFLRKGAEVLGAFDDSHSEGVEKTPGISFGEKDIPFSSLDGPAVRVPPGCESCKSFVEKPPPRTSRGGDGLKIGHLPLHHHVDEAIRHGDDPKDLQPLEAPGNLGGGENFLFEFIL